ncbi:MAG TPA: ribosome maturation factor RimM [Jatrophihabitantaceae bacterium]|nr:ribosome maturation factor RimM [Jatrophihabitantaceae bacterium]
MSPADAESSATPGRELVAVGRIGAARGIRGDVFVEPWTDDPDVRFAEGVQLQTDPADRGPLTVEASNAASGKLVIRFAGIGDRSAAEALRGVQLLVAASERPVLDDPDEYYVTDLIGLAVSTVEGTDLGSVQDVIDVAGADYLVLEVDGRERLVPFVAAIVPTVDLAAGHVMIDPPDGLFDL